MYPEWHRRQVWFNGGVLYYYSSVTKIGETTSTFVLEFNLRSHACSDKEEGWIFWAKGPLKIMGFPTKTIHSPKVRCFGVSFLRFTCWFTWSLFFMIKASEITSGLYHAPKKTFPIFQETHLHSIKCRSQENHFLTPVNAGGKACIPQKFNIRQLLKTGHVWSRSHHFPRPIILAYFGC